VPTFGEQEKSLEVYLIGSNNDELENIDRVIVKIEIIKYLRGISKFQLVGGLIKQIEKDVKNIQELKI
jgi:FAD synthase